MRPGVSQVRIHRSSAVQSNQGRNGDEESSSRECQSSSLYRDFALVSTDSILKIVEPPKAKRKGPRGGVQTPFPVRLFDMLEAAHKEGLESIVSWQPHGRSFIVRKSGQFEARLLPRFFSQSKMSSFQRQLNLYGFLRQNTGPDRGSYYHELFLRGRPDLPKMMLRTRVKGIGMGRTNKVEKEPDFYKMTPCLPNGDKTYQDIDMKETDDLAPASPRSPEPSTTASYEEDVSLARPSLPTPQQWIAPPPLAPIPPVQRVSPSFTSAVVTPMSERGGRPLFATSSCSPLTLTERASSLANPCMPPPPPPPPFIHTSQAPLPPTLSTSNLLAHPVRTISAQLPMIPINDNQASGGFYLHPRYTETHDEYYDSSNNDDDLENTALFEGLEFQVVDDDSLEQFESELISDGSSVSGSL